MLNRVILMGRITNDLEIRQSQNGTSVLRFGVAVDRSYAKQGEERQTDFINCVAFNQRAEFISKYFRKGSMIAIEGSIRTGSYQDQNGNKRTTFDVNIDNVSFTGEKASDRDSSSQSQYRKPTQQQPAYNEPSSNPIAIGNMDDFEEILSDDGVPF